MVLRGFNFFSAHKKEKKAAASLLFVGFVSAFFFCFVVFVFILSAYQRPWRLRPFAPGKKRTPCACACA